MPTLKQVQNYIARIRTKRSSPGGSQSPTPSASSSIVSASVTPVNIKPLNGSTVSEEQKALDQLLGQKSSDVSEEQKALDQLLGQKSSNVSDEQKALDQFLSQKSSNVSEEQKALDQLLGQKGLQPILGQVSGQPLVRKRGRPRLNPDQRVERVGKRNLKPF